jgi:two-component system response regulator HydG
VIGDRFLAGADNRCIDLATGLAVDVRIDLFREPLGERARRTLCDLAIVDSGRTGIDHWFEARAVEPQAGRLDRLAGRIAREVRLLGVVPVRSGSRRCHAAIASLARRHVALLVWTRADRRALAWWRRSLAASGQRRHVVISIARRERRFRVAIRPLRAGKAVVRMHIDELLSPLLHIFQDAEDDVAALAGACRWMRRAAGVDAVAFLAAGGTVVSSLGWDADDQRPPAEIDVRYQGERIGSVAARGIAATSADGLAVLRAVAALSAPALRSRLDVLETARSSHRDMPELVGRSPSMFALRDAIARVAATDFAVLIEGESGTGKELAARAIHRLSPRRDRRLCAVNCAALGDDLVEAELFGHTRGAFTGAVGARAGLFEEADGGTLFLDEVGELSPRAQAKLLRALQDGEIRRVGENVARRVHVRVVAATNRPLAAMAASGAFRDDLVFRLAVATIRMPALRDRTEDVPLLALTFWKDLAARSASRAILDADALAALCRYDWPGNVRELQNVMAGLVLVAPSRGRVTPRHVAQVLASHARRHTDELTSLDAGRARWEQRAVATALARHGGRRSAAARELGLTRQGLSKAMKRLGLLPKDAHASRGVA